MSSERSEIVGSPVKVWFALNVVKPFTDEVVKVCSGPKYRMVKKYGPKQEMVLVFRRAAGLGFRWKTLEKQ